ncbi:MAG: cysteine-rich CWC family protein, partial [Pyrinomonadaceae bacterium]
MKVPRLLTRVLPTIKRAQSCPECGEPFACEIGLKGCWCGQVKVRETTLKELRAKYKSCLCRACLE